MLFNRTPYLILGRNGHVLKARRAPDYAALLSTFSTTGTINASSNSLAVANAAGLAIGDRVIVAVGGEAGLGQRGTHGVGGEWPSLYYADNTAKDADTSKPTNTVAWVESTGLVWQWNGSVWTQTFPGLPVGWYYTAKAVPRALIATITAKVGNVLTLSSSAVAGATNANVYFDNYPILNLAKRTNQILLPEGDFVTGSNLLVSSQNDFSLIGEDRAVSRLVQPDGVPLAYVFQASGLSGVVVRDCAIICNGGNQGFGLGPTMPSVGVISAGPDTIGHGLSFFGCSAGEVRNVDVENSLYGGINYNSCFDCYNYNSQISFTYPQLEYLQWPFQYSDCDSGGAIDCTVDSAYYKPGFNSFRSTGVGYTRCHGQNASFAANTSQGYRLEDCSVTVEASASWEDRSEASSDFAGLFRLNPLVNINNNAGGYDVSGGADIIDMVMNIEGAVNAVNNGVSGIVVNSANPNIRITGGSYAANPGYSGYNGGAVPDTPSHAIAINADGGSTYVDGFDASGAVNPSAGESTGKNNICVAHGEVINSTGVTFVGGPPI